MEMATKKARIQSGYAPFVYVDDVADQPLMVTVCVAVDSAPLASRAVSV